MYQEIDRCRICGSDKLTSFLHLGTQALTGVFPKQGDAQPAAGPLELCMCGGECGLVQLRHSYNLSDLYGEHYGYRSGLNQSMVDHLREKVASFARFVSLAENDIIVDIGSNDGTTLGFYPDFLRRIGFDPSAAKFSHYYKPGIELVTDFFNAETFRSRFGSEKARIITSIAMFYDLEDPQTFVDQIASMLAPDGIWHFEQSYMPTMLEANAYDTICHEHLEYYGLKQIKFMTDKAGLKIIDICFNAINGGSFAVTVARKEAPQPEAEALVRDILNQEEALGLNTIEPFTAFAKRTEQHREALLEHLADFRAQGKKVFGYGASTKGNVILQYCGITAKDISCIAEVNESKFGCVTPGSGIPIVSEAEAKLQKPDIFFVLPWHFKENLLSRERAFLAQGGKMFFPLPFFDLQ